MRYVFSCTCTGKECLRFPVGNFWITVTDVTAVIRHELYFHWICGWVLVIRFLSYCLRRKLRAKELRVMKERAGRREVILAQSSLWVVSGECRFTENTQRPCDGPRLHFWLVGFCTSLIPPGSLVEAIWDFIFMDVMWFYKIFSSLR